MDGFKLGNWSYSKLCFTEDPTIWMIELQKGDKRWYARFDSKSYVFIDALPVDCTGSNVLSEPPIYNLTISI